MGLPADRRKLFEVRVFFSTSLKGIVWASRSLDGYDYRKMGKVAPGPCGGAPWGRDVPAESRDRERTTHVPRVTRPGPLRARECWATPWEKHITHRRRQPRKALNVPLGSSAHPMWDARVDGMAVMTVRGGRAVPKAEGS